MATSPDCCIASGQVGSGTDLGHADGFDVTLRVCANCGAEWAEVFCEASASGASVRIDAEEAARLRAFAPGPERKAALRAWLRERAESPHT